MTDITPSLLRRLIDRVFPRSPDFFALLAEQCGHVGHTSDLLVRFMETNDPDVGALIRMDEHEADLIKARNIHILNEAFSTPIDREDIYRSITSLDEIVNYCKSTVSEMKALGVEPDPHLLEMARQIQGGVKALVRGHARLATDPEGAAEDADVARKAERRVEKLYRHALADLFQGTDFVGMFKRREIYRHMSNAADRMASCANTLHDIVVKLA